jgi:uncharacterized protein (TIGR02266 family)
VASEQQNPHRRRHPRFPYLLRVEYPDRDDFVGEWTENLSASGLFVCTERAFSVGEPIRISLSFPGLLPPMPVGGRVAWVRQSSPIQLGGVGVEVTDAGPRRRLTELAVRAAVADRLDVSQPFSMLVVEDNRRLVRAYDRVVERSSAVAAGRLEVEYCGDGQSALGLVKQRRIDLILTDIYMPGMDGFTLVERVRENPALADIPVIMITGGRAGENQRAERMGIRAFLHKPVKFGEILETIASLTGQVTEADANAAMEADCGEAAGSEGEAGGTGARVRSDLTQRPGIRGE